jgi:hypothetical protein
VAARQTLNATAALATARTGELGGAPLDWLLHLDADERFHLEGDTRGGADLHTHFAAAAAAGWKLLRYANHELLAPLEASPHTADGGAGSPIALDADSARLGRVALTFKLNPRLAAARLGTGGWRQLVQQLEMAQDAPRPYFRAYHNGKSAVAVAGARAAAGVHGWRLDEGESDAQGFLAGPSILHLHFASRAAFRRKYRALAEAIADSPSPVGKGGATEEGSEQGLKAPTPPAAGPRLFEPSPVERTLLATIRGLRRDGATEAGIDHHLDELHARLLTFTPAETELLAAAGLLHTVELDPGR